MTKILFFLNQQTLIFLETEQTVSSILSALSLGEWKTFQPLDQLLPKTISPEAIQITPFGSWVFVHFTTETPTVPGKPVLNLSPRQQEVLSYLAQGLTNKQIAYRLKLSQRTVNLHIAAIKRKLGAQTSAQSVSRAAALGFRPRFYPPAKT